MFYLIKENWLDSDHKRGNFREGKILAFKNPISLYYKTTERKPISVDDQSFIQYPIVKKKDFIHWEPPTKLVYFGHIDSFCSHLDLACVAK